jgi:hypothetical protein
MNGMEMLLLDENVSLIMKVEGLEVRSGVPQEQREYTRLRIDMIIIFLNDTNKFETTQSQNQSKVK